MTKKKCTIHAVQVLPNTPVHGKVRMNMSRAPANSCKHTTGSVCCKDRSRVCCCNMRAKDAPGGRCRRAASHSQSVSPWCFGICITSRQDRARRLDCGRRHLGPRHKILCKLGPASISPCVSIRQCTIYARIVHRSSQSPQTNVTVSPVYFRVRCPKLQDHNRWFGGLFLPLWWRIEFLSGEYKYFRRIRPNSGPPGDSKSLK